MVFVFEGFGLDVGFCFLEFVSLVSVFLVFLGLVSGEFCRGGGCVGFLGENRVEFRGCRNVWFFLKGIVSVSRSEGFAWVVVVFGLVGGFWVGGRCR